MKHIDELITRYPALKECKSAITETTCAIVEMHKKKGKLLLCGNGGSAADCEHISGELLKGFLLKRETEILLKDGTEQKSLQGGIASIPLPSLTALVSAFSNDVDPSLVYAQLTYVLGRENDVLLGISTSGNALNVSSAVKVASSMNMKTVGLTGKSGGKLKDLCDICICVPETETFKIQEYHLPVYHAICAQCEDEIFK